jgi:hypothetical protein
VIGGVVYAGGIYDGTIDLPVPPSNGLKDAVIATFALDGTPGFARSFGGTGCDGIDVVHEGGNEIILAGSYSGTVNLGDGPHTAVSGADTLVATFPPGGTVTWSTTFDGGATDEYVSSVAGSRLTNLYVSTHLSTSLGSTCTDFPVGGRGVLHRL